MKYIIQSNMENKCVNACSDNILCKDINLYYGCVHYCCIRTTILLNHCIQCGNNNKREIKIQRCKSCELKLYGVSKMCMYCEDENMYSHDKYGYDDDTEEQIIQRRINTYPNKY